MDRNEIIKDAIKKSLIAINGRGPNCEDCGRPHEVRIELDWEPIDTIEGKAWKGEEDIRIYEAEAYFYCECRRIVYTRLILEAWRCEDGEDNFTFNVEKCPTSFNNVEDIRQFLLCCEEKEKGDDETLTVRDDFAQDYDETGEDVNIPVISLTVGRNALLTITPERWEQIKEG